MTATPWGDLFNAAARAYDRVPDFGGLPLSRADLGFFGTMASGSRTVHAASGESRLAVPLVQADGFAAGFGLDLLLVYRSYLADP
ncbi:MAG: hypothetical protein ACE5F1_04140, partial [Planctomycetota bacterium]